MTGRHYSPHPRQDAALTCSECGALVADLDAHETWHALTPSVSEVAQRVARVWALTLSETITDRPRG